MKKEVLGLTFAVLLGDITYAHFSNRKPLVQQAYLSASRPFVSLETVLERDFNIIYEGDKSEAVVEKLYYNLSIIRNENPELLKNTKKIIVFPKGPTELGEKYIGTATVDGTIKLRNDYELHNLAHEAAHTCSYDLSLGFRSIFCAFDNQSRGLMENVARVVETFYYEMNYPYLKCKKPTNEVLLNALRGEGLISWKQCERAIRDGK
ncbi:MAG: hypothetical protein AABX39_03590 [Nanoarchaeota archaeon]